jgi:hypothetical protein
MTELIKEISDWQIEAKSEDNERYFFHLTEANEILHGRKNYVVGRKGTGKTAISEHITKIGGGTNGIFTEKLSFKFFPFNELYGLNDEKYTLPNQYITIWKYLIYSFVCRMMLKNSNINESVREELSLSYNLEPITNLTVVVEEWTSAKFEVIDRNKITKLDNSLISWIEKVRILENIIIKYLDDAKYYVIFDELDEDYRDVKDKGQATKYNYLLTSLFKAVQDIRNVIRPYKKQLIPIIFLRDDIYTIIKDPDKNKWSDLRIDIDWDENKIKKLLAFRISRAFDKNISQPLSFNDAWLKFFENKPVSMGNRQQRSMPIFEYITKSTHLRPRDFVKFLQACAKEAVESNRKIITPTIVRRVDKAFSNYLKNEIIDEIQAVLPEIDTVFQIISQLGKQTFKADEFKTIYSSYLNNNTLQEGNVNDVLQKLFDFGVLGNQAKNPNVQPVFRYKNREARLNTNENLIVHRGLLKSLQLY